MLGKGSAASKNLMLTSHKRTVSFGANKSGDSTIKSRHALPVDIGALLGEQKGYRYTETQERDSFGRVIAKTADTRHAESVKQSVHLPQI